MLEKLLQNKKTQMSPEYKSAKMQTLKDLHGAMSDMMKDDLANAKGMKHVEVAGSDPEALAAGLDKAKEMVSDKDASSHIMDDGMESGEEGSDDAASLIKELVDHETSEGDLTADGIDQLIQMLEQKKMELSGHGE